MLKEETLHKAYLKAIENGFDVENDDVQYIFSRTAGHKEIKKALQYLVIFSHVFAKA